VIVGLDAPCTCTAGQKQPRDGVWNSSAKVPCTLHLPVVMVVRGCPPAAPGCGSWQGNGDAMGCGCELVVSCSARAALQVPVYR
jgi:hypothetical protein